MIIYSHACREKCLRSEDPEFPAADGSGVATDDPREPIAGRTLEATAAEELEDSPPSPRRCWMEWSWKQGSDSRTEAARDTLRGERAPAEVRPAAVNTHTHTYTDTHIT